MSRRAGLSNFLHYWDKTWIINISYGLNTDCQLKVRVQCVGLAGGSLLREAKKHQAARIGLTFKYHIILNEQQIKDRSIARSMMQATTLFKGVK